MKEREFKISEERVREIMNQLVSALQYFHQYGIVHRDLKLENIMMSDISDSAIAKIGDFGLA